MRYSLINDCLMFDTQMWHFFCYKVFDLLHKLDTEQCWCTWFLTGFTEWGDDADILAQVIAQSQHEYLASLKKNSAAAAKNSEVAAAGTSSRDSAQAKNDAATGSTTADKGKSPMPKDRHI